MRRCRWPNKADYVSQKIAEAKAQGKNVAAAETQEKIGRASMRRGMSKKADEHFDTVLRFGRRDTECTGKQRGRNRLDAQDAARFRRQDHQLARVSSSCTPIHRT